MWSFIYSKEDNIFESNQCLCGESTGSDADHICKWNAEEKEYITKIRNEWTIDQAGW